MNFCHLATLDRMRIEAADALVRNQWAVKAGETKAQVRMGNKSPEEEKDPLFHLLTSLIQNSE